MERSARLILLLDYARCVVSPAHQISPGNGLTLLAPVLAVPSLSFLQLQRVSHFRMGILVITWNYPPRRGGMEYLVSNVVRGLRKRHSVCLSRHTLNTRPLRKNVFIALHGPVWSFSPYTRFGAAPRYCAAIQRSS